MAPCYALRMAEMSHPEAEGQGLSQANAVKDTRPVYEVGYHVVPTIPEDALAGVVEKIRAILGDVEFISDKFPQKLVLAYTIERRTQGKREKYGDAYFGFIKFACERESIPKIEQGLRAERDVLRFLLIETTREDTPAPPRRAVFTSSRLEGEVIKKPEAAEEKKGGQVSEEELNKSIEALVS